VIVSIFSNAIARNTTNPVVRVSDRRRDANRGLGRLLWMLLPAMILCCQWAAPAANNSVPANSVHQLKNPVESPMKFSGVIYKSGNRRDPFINPLLVKKKDKRPVDEELSRGLPPPGITGTYIAQALLQGISVRENGRVAVFRGADARAYFLRRGDKLFDGYLKDIHNDSVTLVRETRMRSGKVLTQDVIKRLRTP